MNKMPVLIGWFLVCVAHIFVAACQTGTVELKNEKYHVLLEKIQKYYELEKGNEWGKAYYFRTPSYRQSVTLDYYVSTMKNDNSGWELLDYKILSAVKSESNEIAVEMEFLEKIPEDSYINKALGGKYDKTNFTESSVWIDIDGEWYCKSAGARTHLPLNRSFE